MRLKPLFATMVAAGVASVAIAGGQPVAHHMEAMKAKIARLESVLDQNQGQAYSFAHLPMAQWANRLTVSGLANVDAVYARRTPVATNYYSLNNSFTDVGVTNANLYFDAELNCWTTAHVGLNYYGSQNNRLLHIPRGFGVGQTFGVDEAYVTISNFAKSPVYLRAGQQYVDFGSYSRFNIAAPLTQMLSMTRDEALTLGYNDASGFHASGYIFSGLISNTGPATHRHLNNGGVRLGYAGQYDGVNYHLDGGYLNNMADVHYISTSEFFFGLNTFRKRVGGLSLHGDMTYQQFDATVDYVTAMSRFNVLDWPVIPASTEGAKPKAFNLDVGYTFDSMGLPSRVGLGFQRSWESSMSVDAYDNLPKARYQAQYGLGLGRNTELTFALISDHDYASSTAGTGNNNLTGVVRLGVRFA